MRWSRAQALSYNDLVNLFQGRTVENIITDQKIPLDDGGFLEFRFAIKLFGVAAFIGFHDDQPYVLHYWKPV